MFTLRVVRHDQHDELLAECRSVVIPARGEVIQLDTADAQGHLTRPSTLWRVIAVTLHIPSVRSAAPEDGSPLSVQSVDVVVLPDVGLVPEIARAAEALSVRA